jgi:ADP-ribose pyrophosphatase YjhB (NUDIX family)
MRKVASSCIPGVWAVAGPHRVDRWNLRELGEETGLTVDVERLIGVYSDPAYQIVHYPDGRAIQFVTCLFACRLRGGNLQGSEEGTAWGWFSPASLPEDLTPYARVWLRDAISGEAQVVVR